MNARAVSLAFATALAAALLLPPGAFASGDASSSEGAIVLAQAGCAAGFCDETLEDCYDACTENMVAGPQREMCEGLCDDIAERCTDCCAAGGTSPDCWE